MKNFSAYGFLANLTVVGLIFSLDRPLTNRLIIIALFLYIISFISYIIHLSEKQNAATIWQQQAKELQKFNDLVNRLKNKDKEE